MRDLVKFCQLAGAILKARMSDLFKMRIFELLTFQQCLLLYFLAGRQLLLREVNIVGEMVSLSFQSLDSLQLRLKGLILDFRAPG